jgi:hypothetical protein
MEQQLLLVADVTDGLYPLDQIGGTLFEETALFIAVHSFEESFLCGAPLSWPGLRA